MMDGALNIQQGTDEWHAARLGRVTASRIADVMAKGRGNAPSATRANYMADLICETLTGRAREGFTSKAMEEGSEREGTARNLYAFMRDADVDEVGFVVHPKIERAGASPDGLVGSVGLVEIKCPQPAAHIAILEGKSIDGGYLKQMQWQMACTGRDWCDFVSFNPDFPEAMQLHIRRIERDAPMIVEMEQAVRAFLAEMDAKIENLRGMYP